MSSELLKKLTDIDSRAAAKVSAAEVEAEKIAAAFAAGAEKLEKAAEEKLAAEVEKRAAELAAGREKELAAIEADKRSQMKCITAVPAERIADGAAAVAARLTEE